MNIGSSQNGGAASCCCVARTALDLVSTLREKRAQRVLTKANKSDHMHTGEIVESSSSIMGPYVTLLELFPSLESLLTLFKKDKINFKKKMG